MTTEVATKPFMDNTNKLPGYRSSYGLYRPGTIIAQAFNVDGRSERAGLLPEGADENASGWYNWIRYEGDDTFIKVCRKCGGDGQHWADHIADGECFRCSGCGEEPRVGQKTLQQLEAMQKAAVAAVAREERLYQERVAKQIAKQEALKAVAPDVYEAVMAVSFGEWNEQTDEVIVPREKSAFMLAMAGNLQYMSELDKPFTENMIAAVRKGLAAKAEAAANAEANPVIEGKVVITGEILSAKWVENDFGSSMKIVVKDDRGFRVYGTAAAAILGVLADDELKGARVTFSATVEVSKDDKGFGFFKRPTKAEVL